MERDLAEAKRKGLVSTGSFEKPKKGERQQVRSDFTKSSHFFKAVGENVAAAGTAGGPKRKRGPAGDDPARTSAKYKL